MPNTEIGSQNPSFHHFVEKSREELDKMIALIGSSKKLTKQQLDCIATTMSALKKELVTERESVSFSLPAACLQVGNPKSINEYARKELDKFNNKYQKSSNRMRKYELVYQEMKNGAGLGLEGSQGIQLSRTESEKRALRTQF